MNYSREFFKGIWKENPVLVLMLGMCPSLATTGNGSNALGMGLATTFVLACSNLVISSIRKIVPGKIRIPCYIVVIAAFVTVVDLLMQAYTGSLYKALGIFIPLIVVNCIVLGRAEAFASKHGLVESFLDGAGMGCGFTLALVLIGLIREFLSAGTLFNIHIAENYPVTFAVMGQAPGGFIVMGFILAGMNFLNMRKAKKEGGNFVNPVDMDCRHCMICRLPEDEK
ncbi:MAG: electron transport complex subunit E [Lentisphaeria bacterium]|nr:electron transport complex subunit E [Lentisphaeria bacterium]